MKTTTKKMGSKVAKALTAICCLGAFNAEAQYCTAVGGNGCSQWNTGSITDVAILGTALSNTSGCNTNGNGDTYTAYPPGLGTTATLSVGLVYTISVTSDDVSQEAFWIDFNANNTFDANEWVLITSSSTANAASTATFLVPPIAVFGQTTLRVRTNSPWNQFNPTDACTSFYSGETEDYTLTIAPSQPCITTPFANTAIASQTLVCPVFGTSMLNVATNYTIGGISYIWEMSTGNAIGPYNAVANATQQAYTTPTLNTTTWYRMKATCVNGGVTMTTTPVQIQVAATTSNTVPYYESFEGIVNNNDLPNCSWWRSNNQQCGTETASITALRSARTGNAFAEFNAYQNAYYQMQYFYSNGIQLNAGVTYSASVWYRITQNFTSWQSPSLSFGPNQSPTGLVTLATSPTPYLSNTTYQPLTATFTVATSGIYYLSVNALNNYAYDQLVWDDLAITAPCTIPGNPPTITLTGSTTICAGQTANLSAAGASSYTWSTGSTSNTTAVAPTANAIYTVTGINPLSGCMATAIMPIAVNQLPEVSIIALKQQVCLGESVTLIASSATSYTWNVGPTFNSVITVTPTLANNTFTVIGRNALGCKATAVQQISVNPLPIISVSGNTFICQGSTANLMATGAGAGGTYEWVANTLYLKAPAANVSPNVTTTYSVSGVDANNCKGLALVTVAVDPCTGLQTLSGSAAGALVYPNPNAGVFTVTSNSGLNKTIEVSDITGRLLLSSSSDDNALDIDISAFANGVYYVKIKSGGSFDVIKVIKQ